MDSQEKAKNRFSAGLLVKNTSLNVVGQIIPILVALFSMPVLIKSLGAERFGVLMLAWMCLGYFNLFDFGLSRALTKNIAERLDTDRENEVPSLFWTTISATALLGIIGGATLWLSSHWLAKSVLNIPEALEQEATTSLQVIAVCLPLVITTTGLKGLLEATQNFVQINMIQIPMGLAFYLLPIVFSAYSRELPLIIAALFFARAGGWIFFMRACLRAIPKLRGGATIAPSLLPDLFRFGGWVTVSNILSPLIGYGDRFLLGAMLSMSAVTYYSTPYEIVNKLWIFPGAVMGVVFPALASYLSRDPERAGRVYLSATKLLFGILVPLTVIVVLLSKEGLMLWAGPELSEKSSTTMQILGIAVLFNCFGMVPAALLDALGRPKIPALLHLIELPIYFGVLYKIIPIYGLEGAAVVWIGRNAFDTSLLYLISARVFPAARIRWAGVLRTIFPLVVFLIFCTVVKLNLGVRLVLLASFGALFPPWLWFRYFHSEDRSRVLRTLSSFFRPQRVVRTARGRKKVGIALAAFCPPTEFFVRQLQTIKDQTYENWFCVISMDSDIDLDAESLASFRKDSRFIWVRNEGKPGVKSNFQNAVQYALKSGADLIAFADQDDVWYPSKLERLVAEIKTCPPMSLVHSNMHVFSKDDELTSGQKLSTGWEIEMRVVHDYSPLHYFLRNTVTGASCLFDAELATFSDSIPDAIDFHDQWYAIIASICGEVRSVNEPLYAYRQHGNNVVGVIRYSGLFFKPANVSWLQGVRKSIANYKKTRDLENSVRALNLGVTLPSAYRFALRHPFGAFVFLTIFAFLNSKDDPTLARAALAKGIGAGASIIGS